jgi:glycosyltransferase involved in cell wall biosynthesis
MAHIAIDGRKYFDFGIGTYVQNLVAGISRSNSSHGYSLIVSPGDLARIESPLGWQKHATRLRKYSLGEMTLLGHEARKAGADLLHVPHYTLPLGLRRRSVVTIHDLVHVAFPQYFTLTQRTYARAVLRHAVRDAGAVITGSHQAKTDIVNLFRIDERRVHVIYHGMQSHFKKLEDPGKLQGFRDRFHLPRPFILYVGSIKPHKNIPVLLRAFRKVPRSGRDIQIVFMGESLFLTPRLSGLSGKLGVTQRIRYLRRVSQNDLAGPYNSAGMPPFPAFCDGFGRTGFRKSLLSEWRALYPVWNSLNGTFP